MAEALPALDTAVATSSASSPYSNCLVLLLLRGGRTSLARAPPSTTAPVLLAEGVEVGLVPGAELEADLQVGRGLSQVLLPWCVVVQELLHMGHLQGNIDQ